MRHRIFAALAGVAACVLIAPSPTSAQGLSTAMPLNQEKQKTPEQIEKEKAAEAAYKASLKTIPDAKQTVDPWGNMRSPSIPPAASKGTGAAQDNVKTTAKTTPKKPIKLVN